MQIYRSNQSVALPNALLQDDRLSYLARGVLVDLLSRDESADVSIESLRTGGRGGGRKSISDAFAELEALGYIVRSRSQGEKGRFTSHLDVYDTPGHAA